MYPILLILGVDSLFEIKILKEGSKGLDSLDKLVKKVIDYCGPLDNNTVNAIHFCFNSLGLNNDEEDVALRSYSNQPIPIHLHRVCETIIKNLFERESWNLKNQLPRD